MDARGLAPGSGLPPSRKRKPSPARVLLGGTPGDWALDTGDSWPASSGDGSQRACASSADSSLPQPVPASPPRGPLVPVRVFHLPPLLVEGADGRQDEAASADLKQPSPRCVRRVLELGASPRGVVEGGQAPLPMSEQLRRSAAFADSWLSELELTAHQRRLLSSDRNAPGPVTYEPAQAAGGQELPPPAFQILGLLAPGRMPDHSQAPIPDDSANGFRGRATKGPPAAPRVALEGLMVEGP